jgi:hypothetical protein
MKILAFCLAFLFLQTGDPQPPSNLQSPPITPGRPDSLSTAPPENWAESFLAQDPLNAKETVTLDEIRGQLLDPILKKTAIQRHFSKVDASLEDRVSFLGETLEDGSVVVQQQAATELLHLDALESVVVEKLLRFVSSEEISKREAAIVGLRSLTIDESLLTERHWSILIEALASDEDTVRDAARDQLRRQGARSVPLLMNALSDDRSRLQREAAKLLSEILGTTPSEASVEPADLSKRTPAPIPMAGSRAPEPPLAKGAKSASKKSTLRSLEESPSTMVRVYYGTNRQRLEQAEKSTSLCF